MSSIDKRIGVIGCGASLAALLAATPALAQETPAPAAATQDDNAIIVTGTRVVRSGFTAPTPETSLGEEELETRAPANIANAINDLPQLTPTLNPSTSGVGVGGGTGGANFLNLRGLGINRTLTLLNGNRVVSSTTTGGVDVNLVPQGLVSRVDVVTGGASAAWGSDAVAGVVNFVLNTKYEGLKAHLSAGSSFEGDAGTYNGNLTFGTSFADGRGHLLVDVGGAVQNGVDHFTDRDWYKGWKVVNNPAYTATNGQPRQLVSTGDFLVASGGGVIISGARALNTAFDANGNPFAYNPGTPTSPYKIGGTPNDIGAGYPLVVPVKYGNVFGRLSYDLLDSLTAYVEVGYSASSTVNKTASYVSLGNVTIQADNAYLPAGFTGAPFVLGKVFESLGTPQPRNDRTVMRIVGGLEGKLGGSWSWKAYYQYGESRVLNEVSKNPIVPNVVRATDAIRNAAGQIVCRSAATNPDCVPFNPFGTTLASAAARGYATGTAAQNIVIKQQVAAATVNGEPFSLWAGPVSFAAGAEYRTESYAADADPLSVTSSYWVGNYKPGSGRYNVKEAFAEVVVPLARDITLLKSLDLNLAGRITDYSTSGTVKTYKAGAIWDVIDGLRLRGTHSRDIRAPNLSELFLGGQANTLIVNDPQNGGASYGVVQVLQGNASLKPEIATTNTFGVVLRPSFVPGLSASVDYYRTRITDAITNLGGQQIVDNCALGQTVFCAAVIRNGGTPNLITRVNISGFNASVEKVSGIDYELSYTTALSALSPDLPGSFTLRMLASNTRERTITALGVTTNYLGMVGQLGAGGPPKWRWMGSATYDSDFMRTQLTMRHIGSGVLDNRNIECTTGCPASTTARPTIDNNQVKSATYFDLSQTFKIKTGGKDAEFYVVVENLFDRDPPVIALASFLAAGAGGVYHDLIGRRFRVGFRFEY
ncbi:TonB-dependent receptor [Sphingomonas sp. MG17]|uniref:TonB-dependent receptor n=1 Tax=Sphingomonas tagetis TaxID=2949092 RepID=A0A9X2HKT7_9SPHN|nr:TonB-dependent receptor [Sphingomonas tagetis]MCP3731009.1 TonB-dependent receptor [Sphingomonas tagetis]